MVSFETMVYVMLTRGLAMIGAVVVARVLGPAGKGTLAYMTSIFAFAIAVFAGHMTAIVYQYGKRGVPMSTVYPASLKVIALVIVPAAALIAAVAIAVPGQGALLAAAAALPLAAYVQSTRGFFLADSEIRRANMQAFIAPAIFAIAGSISLLFFHGNLNTLLLIFVLSYLPAVGYSIEQLRILRSQRPSESDPKPVASQLAFAASAGSVNFVAFLNGRIDLFIILFVLGVKAVGVYSVAVTIAEGLWQLSGPVSVAAYGSISTQSEWNSAKLTAQCIRTTLPFALVVSVLTYFLAPPLVTLVFGARFAEAGYVTRYFLPGVVVWSIMYFLNNFITVQLGKPRLVLMIVGISAAVCGIATFALVHTMGIASGAIGSSLGYLIGAPWAVWIFLRRSKVKPLELVAFNKDDMQRYLALFASLWRRAGAVFAR